VFVAGASGYMGQQLVRELVAQKYEVVCLVRPGVVAELNGAEVRIGDVCDPGSLQKEGFRGQQFDAVFSCLSTRNGGIKDAWAVDHQANLHLLEAARRAEVTHFVLLSAICVQKPLLAFQHAKLTFEKALMESGLTWSIVRPTAFFKSLAGQVEAVRSGKPFKVFGDGRLTACKPIAEADLARFMASCLTDRGKRNAILPIGGPGDAITPREQGELLFALCKRPVRFQHIPVGLFDGVIAVLDLLSIVIPTLRDKAEFARIGRYYATESMLWLDPVKGSYDADATPAFGTITLRDFYERVLQEGLAGQELRSHALFHPRNQ
jgi:divinyl chlorophyllide a 8-vinyl-reductase